MPTQGGSVRTPRRPAETGSRTRCRSMPPPAWPRGRCFEDNGCRSPTARRLRVGRRGRAGSAPRGSQHSPPTRQINPTAIALYPNQRAVPCRSPRTIPPTTPAKTGMAAGAMEAARAAEVRRRPSATSRTNGTPQSRQRSSPSPQAVTGKRARGRRILGASTRAPTPNLNAMMSQIWSSRVTLKRVITNQPEKIIRESVAHDTPRPAAGRRRQRCRPRKQQ